MIEHNFRGYVDKPLKELVVEIADVHSRLANAIEDIAFMRAENIRQGVKGTNDEIIGKEATRDVLIEKKFLLARLIDLRASDAS